MTRLYRTVTLQDQTTGAPVAGMSVTVYVADPPALASIYAAESGGSPIVGSTVTSNSSGVYAYWIEPGSYYDQISKSGYITDTVEFQMIDGYSSTPVDTIVIPWTSDSTDVTTLVQAAADTLSPDHGGNGGIIRFLAGDYLCGPVTLHPAVSVAGAGKGTTRITLAASASGPLFTSLARGRADTFVAWAPGFSDFTLVGNKASQTAARHGIYCEPVTNDPNYSGTQKYRAGFCMDMDVLQCSGSGVYVDVGRAQFYCRSLIGVYNDQSGLVVNSAADPYIGPYSGFGNNGQHSVLLTGVSRARIQGAALWNSNNRAGGYYAVNYYQCYGGFVTNCQVNDTIRIQGALGPGGNTNAGIEIANNFFAPASQIFSGGALIGGIDAYVYLVGTTGIEIQGNTYHPQAASGDKFAYLAWVDATSACHLDVGCDRPGTDAPYRTAPFYGAGKITSIRANPESSLVDVWGNVLCHDNLTYYAALVRPATPVFPSSGGTVTLPNTSGRRIIGGAVTLSSLTIEMPTAPVDGQDVELLFQSAVTSLTLTPGSGQTINSPATSAAAGQVLRWTWNATQARWYRMEGASSGGGGGGSGTVTSVALTAPTGFSVAGSPVTSSGALALSFAAGYALPTTTKQTNWDDAYTVTAAQTTVGYAVWTAATQAAARAAIGAGTGDGTVTSASVVSANGFGGTVATAGTTPAITLTTSVTGLLKGNGTALSAAVAGTDYVAPSGALGTPSSGTLTNCTGLPLSTGATGVLPVANGGTGTATPGLVAGSNVTITGAWPNQTIAASSGGGSPGGTSGQVQYNNAGAFGGFTVGGDATLNTSTGALTVTKTNGTAFGTAATLNVGTSANNVVQLDSSAKLPAVDGSQLTNLATGGTLLFSGSGSVANTTTETSLFNGTVPGGTLGSDKAVRVEFSATYLNSSGSASTLKFKIKYGSTVLVETNAPSFTSAAGSRVISGAFILYAKGATNSQNARLDIQMLSISNSPSGTGSISTAGFAQAGSIIGVSSAENSVNALTLDMLVTHSVANANTSITLDRAIAYKIV